MLPQIDLNKLKHLFRDEAAFHTFVAILRESQISVITQSEEIVGTFALVGEYQHIFILAADAPRERLDALIQRQNAL